MRNNQFPILTTRKIFWKPVLGELAAFLRGATDLKTFQELGCNYWDANAASWYDNAGIPKENWNVGNIYGVKWRNFHGRNQLRDLVHGLKTEPTSRRHVLTTWDPSETWQCLPPCHLLAQFNVSNDGYLDCIVYMRSVDLCLGLPSDIILYAALTILVAHECGYKPGSLTFFTGDTHIYKNHIETFYRQLSSPEHPLPVWYLNEETSLNAFLPEHLNLVCYQHGDKLEYPFSV